MEQPAFTGEGPEPTFVQTDSATEDSESTVDEQELPTNQASQVRSLSYGELDHRELIHTSIYGAVMAIRSPPCSKICLR